MGLDRIYDEFVGFRMFKEERKQIMQAVRHARDVDGYRKYENESHFIRCAIQRLVRAERTEMEINRGRPKVRKAK